MHAEQPAILATGVRKAYGDAPVVDVDRIEIGAGRVTALLGPSGAGKSTLLRILGLLELPDAGTVEVDGVATEPGTTPASAGVTAVFQEPTMFAGSVERNVGYGLAARGVPSARRDEQVSAALERVGLAHLRTAAATRLSGGEMRRVALARALVTSPGVLLLDEPLASLDEPLRRQLAADFSAMLRADGCGVLWVTHDQNEAAEVADVVYVMRDGRIVSSGPATDVIERPLDAWAAEFVGLAPPLRAIVTSSEDGVLTVEANGSEIVCMGTSAPQTRVLVRVPPDDVMIYPAGEARPRSSARNTFDAKVTGVRRAGAALAVELETDAGALVATVLPASAREIGLAEGAHVTASFKATAARAFDSSAKEAS